MMHNHIAQAERTGGAAVAERENALRHAVAAALFEAMPEVGQDLDHRPDPGETSRAFIDRLAASATPEEAVTFAAQAMALRHGIWWGHECLMRMRQVLEPQDLEMLALAADWVGAPGEETRHRAATAAMACTTKTPGVWIALGVGWTGGSLLPPEQAAVPPPPFLPGRAINAGVLLALARAERDQRARILAGFVSMAHAIIDAG